MSSTLSVFGVKHAQFMLPKYLQARSFLSDIPGLLKDLNNPESLITEIYTDEAKKMIEEGSIKGGMFSKITLIRQNILVVAHSQIPDLSIVQYSNP